jgi:hypothetical protein
MPSTPKRTHGQLRRAEKLPTGDKVVNTRRGAPTVRRSGGQLFRVQPIERLSATVRVQRVTSYLDVRE